MYNGTFDVKSEKLKEFLIALDFFKVLLTDEMSKLKTDELMRSTSNASSCGGGSMTADDTANGSKMADASDDARPSPAKFSRSDTSETVIMGEITSRTPDTDSEDDGDDVIIDEELSKISEGTTSVGVAKKSVDRKRKAEADDDDDDVLPKPLSNFDRYATICKLRQKVSKMNCNTGFFYKCKECEFWDYHKHKVKKHVNSKHPINLKT